MSAHRLGEQGRLRVRSRGGQGRLGLVRPPEEDEGADQAHQAHQDEVAEIATVLPKRAYSQVAMNGAIPPPRMAPTW
jgi:hypothetical protein